MKIFVALYEHKFGSDTTAHQTMAGAQARKDAIGDEWWDTEFPGVTRPVTAIGDAYFDRIDGEFFNIEECEVQP